mmetsp:Transcript_124490/g.398573  ORF Transcript_124490/g.398573 Transcript_124490/m.398573 type:complete len:226 (-) Transcript_124490:43-720(-)
MSFCTGSTLRVNTKDTATLLSDDKFMALEQEVDIIPKFSSEDPIDCIKGKFGPFRAHTAIKVPLWAALEMDRLQQCTIELPYWLHEEELKRLRDDEKDRANADRFMPVNEHYIEIAFALLTQSKASKGAGVDSRRTNLLLREIVELRRRKIISALKDFTATSDAVFDVSNMSAVELSCFRARSLLTLDTFLDFIKSKRVNDKEAEDEEVQGISQPELAEDSSSRL